LHLLESLLHRFLRFT